MGRKIAAALAAATVVAVVLALVAEHNRPWKRFFRVARDGRVAIYIKQARLQKIPEKTIRKTAARMRRESVTIRQITPTLTGKPERCLTCHFGIEAISPSHPIGAFGCVICHGGNRLGLTPEDAHQGLIGGRNPSDYRVVDRTCGQTLPNGAKCHAGLADKFKNTIMRSRRSLMATMAGVILGLRLAWGAQTEMTARYASVGVADLTPEALRPRGTLPFLSTIPVFSEKHLPKDKRGRLIKNDAQGRPIIVSGRVADDQWRKFCARCHVNNDRQQGPSAHLSGCAACHATVADDNRYHGGDPMIDRKKQGHAAKHKLTTAIPNSQCLRCHNRSGRIGLSYMGRFDSDGYGTPYQGGALNKNRLSGGRFYFHLSPDVHFKKGLACIDCHTANDVMGDGHIYSRMRGQVEIKCQTCHGGFFGGPRLGIQNDRELKWKLTVLRKVKLKTGDRPVLTRKGRPMVNVVRRGKKVVLISKLTGKVHPVTVIFRNKKTHTIRAHAEDKMECFACHSRWTAQCYGCHVTRHNSRRMLDSMTRQRTRGAWSETRDYYRFRAPVLGKNSAGLVSTMMPGCQVLFTMLGQGGKVFGKYDRYVFRSKTIKHGIVTTPINPHTTATTVRPCASCHLSQKTLGIGQGLYKLGASWAKNRFVPLTDPKKSGNPLGFAWESLVTPTGDRVLMGTTHLGARPFIAKELRRIIRVGTCLPCHARYDDPIYKDWPKSLAGAGTKKHFNLIKKSLEGAEGAGGAGGE